MIAPAPGRARQLGVNYARGIVIFDAGGKETIRWEILFRVFHTWAC